MKTKVHSQLRLQRKRRIIEDFRAWMLFLPVAISLYLFVWRPTVVGMVWSMFKLKGYTPTEFIGLKNYIEVIQDTQFWPIVLNTLEYVMWSFVVGFIPPLITAVLLNEVIHFKRGFRVIMYLPAVMPTMAVYLMWNFIYQPDSAGLLNSILGVFGVEPYGWLSDPKFVKLYIIIATTWNGFPGACILYYAALQGISPDYYEAATIDGAGVTKKFWHITIPQLLPIVVLNMVRQFISVFQILQQPLAMTNGGPNGASISVGYQLYRYGFVTGRVGHALALGVIIFFMLIGFTSFYFFLENKIDDN